MGGSATGSESVAISSTAEGSTDTAVAAVAGSLGSGSGSGAAAWVGVTLDSAASGAWATRTASLVGTLRRTVLAYSAVATQPETERDRDDQNRRKPP